MKQVDHKKIINDLIENYNKHCKSVDVVELATKLGLKVQCMPTKFYITDKKIYVNGLIDIKEQREAIFLAIIKHLLEN